MSDGVGPVQGDGSDVGNLTQTLTAGRMLRNAREAQGLHVGALAVSMKVPVKKLEALESDRYDLLPDAVFVRALASSVCRTLKIDATPILDKLPRSHTPQLGPGDRAVNEPFYAYGKTGALSFSGLLAKPSVVWVLVFMVATIAVFFWPELQKIPLNHGDDTAIEEPSSVLVPAENPNVPDGVTPILEPPIDAQAGTSPTQTLGSETASPNAVVPAIQKPLMDPVAATTSGVALNDSTAQMLWLKARGPTWVKVVDAKGTVQLMKILVVGEAVSVGGIAPLSVVVGAADSLDVVVRGAPFELQSVARDNVARFEVK